MRCVIQSLKTIPMICRFDVNGLNKHIWVIEAHTIVSAVN